MINFGKDTTCYFCEHCGSQEVLRGETWVECLACGTFAGMDSVGNLLYATVHEDPEPQDNETKNP